MATQQVQEKGQKAMQQVQETVHDESWQQAALRAGKWIAAILGGGAMLSTLVIGGGGLFLLALPVILLSAPIWIPAVTIFTLTTGGLLLFAAFMYALYRGGMYVYHELRGRPEVQQTVGQATDKARETKDTAAREAQGRAGEAQDTISQVAEQAMEYGKESYERAKEVFYG